MQKLFVIGMIINKIIDYRKKTPFWVFFLILNCDIIHVSESVFLMGCENPDKRRQLIDDKNLQLEKTVGGLQNIKNMHTISV